MDRFLSLIWGKKKATSGQSWPTYVASPIPGLTLYSPTFGVKYNSDSLIKLYNEVGAVNAIINYIAAKCGELPINHVRYQSNGKKKVLGETGALRLIQEPNPLKSQNSFIADTITSLLIHGNSPIWMFNVPGFDVPGRMHSMPAQRTYAIPMQSMDQLGTPSTYADPRFNEVVKYRFDLNGKYIDIPKEEIIYIKMPNANMLGADWFYGMSPLFAATRNIDILSGLYDTINTIEGYRGALGFVKRNMKTGQIDSGMDPDAKKKFEEKYLDNYGTKKGQKGIAFTEMDLGWVRIDTPISDFMPVEMDEKQFGHLCNQFMISDILLNSKLQSTYNNVKEATISSYDNCIKPLMSNVLNSISTGLGLPKNGEYLEADYCEISALQEDEEKKYKGLNAKKEYYQGLVDEGMISPNDMLDALGFPRSTDPSMNELKKKNNGTPVIPQ